MSILSLPVVKEIAVEIAAGNTCYVHKKSEKITVIDKSTEDVKTIATQEQQQIELEKEIEDYFVIENRCCHVFRARATAVATSSVLVRL